MIGMTLFGWPMLRLNILPTGHIYDRALRPVRDLLRRRLGLGLVRKRTSFDSQLEESQYSHAWINLAAG